MIQTGRAAALSALLLALAALPSGAESAPPHAAPITIGPRGHLILDVRLNGRGPFPFALDTGAGRTVVNRARLDSLELVERDSDDTGHGAHETFELGLTDVAELQFGTIELESLELVVMDLTPFESPDMSIYGVLGFDVFGAWDLELDLGAGRVSFYPRAETESACAVCSGAMQVPFELNMGTHVQFEVVISDQTMTAFLDTGSGRTGMNTLAARAIGIDLPPTPPGAHGPALQVGEVHLGDGVLARNLVVGVVDLPVLEQFGVSDRPAIVIGTGAIAGKRIGISYGLRRMSVSAEP